ncbi:hypothetical protein BCR42DRAFT_427228 [Absidia repens]|uniref:Heterokaryon incompatibility domain-containing protein n=1 Tax=Absidia repens TaxID=90262 RepID=A0A1X2I1M2_9FUNG|nr:hypothetical protein BCR42DRAFT_427228 [Absidia repens]
MTKEDYIEQFAEDVSPQQQQQQQQKPFKIVLVDIEEAAYNKTIHCVEMPLENKAKDVGYVALSYRWGELHETMIDTQVGYTASVTSFDLDDFYELCFMMHQEVDLKSIKYVWIDAICVNQANYERRKDTIYQMSNIYDGASCILAVPDLHATYLKTTITNNAEIMEKIGRCYGEYIYHLLHKNTDQLDHLDNAFLDAIGLSSDEHPPELRQVLKERSDYFAAGFLNPPKHGRRYDQVAALHRILDQHPSYFPQETKKSLPPPLEKTFKWKQRIQERSTDIQKSVQFLADLIVDWSSRVWVISEYNIAKKKEKKLKYWFIQLMPAPMYFCHANPLTFFEYNFDGSVTASRYDAPYVMASNVDHLHAKVGRLNPVCARFHHTMSRQLDHQTFLEMMLLSKASKNEDRFYSILPLSEYKSKLATQHPVDQWNIHTLCSVKLKLYEWMTTVDKLNLLFMSGASTSSNIGLVFPTFATSTLSSTATHSKDYPSLDNGTYPCNFDLSDTSTIMLYLQHRTSADNNYGDLHEHCHYLHLKPKEYYTLDVVNHCVSPEEKKTLCNRLGIDDALKVVCIPAFGKYTQTLFSPHDLIGEYRIHLIGNALKNKWILDKRRSPIEFLKHQTWTRHKADNHSPGFNIY